MTAGILVTIGSDNEDALVALKDSPLAQGAKIGEVRERPSSSDVNFDPSAAVHLGYEVLSVVSTLGGVIQFGDWIWEKVRDARTKKKRLTLTLATGKHRVVVSADKSEEENRQGLDAFASDVND